MTSNPLGLRLTAIEVAQREGARLAPYDNGTLNAARRTGDPELVARVEAIQHVDERRAKAAAKAKRARERAARKAAK